MRLELAPLGKEAEEIGKEDREEEGGGGGRRGRRRKEEEGGYVGKEDQEGK